MPTTMLRIPTPDGEADTFAAFPDRRSDVPMYADADARDLDVPMYAGANARRPGVLMYTDAFGLRPEIEQKARELADHGFYVLVPNIYYRHGPAPVTELPGHIGEEIRPAIIGRLMPLIAAHTPEMIARDAGAYLEFLTGPVAVVGYCIGAALALRTAAAYPTRVTALAGFHPGFLVTRAPDSPHLSIPEITARVHFGLAENDMSPRAIAGLTDALDAAGVDHTTEIYPGTIHGFAMSDTDAFNPAALQRHWDRLLTLVTAE